MTHQEMIEVLKSLNLVKVVPMDIGNKVERLTDKEYQALQHFIGVGERLDELHQILLNNIGWFIQEWEDRPKSGKGSDRSDLLNKLNTAILTFLREGERLYDKHPDWQEHDKMSTPCLAEHLGLPLYLVMEIARWTNAKPKPEENNV